MGLSIGRSLSWHDRSLSPTEQPSYSNGLPNPDPSNFKIITEVRVRNFTIFKINYPDCTNYEGDKIVVFENSDLPDVNEMIDPHFCDKSDGPSPVARFEPTQRGWKMAIAFCYAYTS